MHDCFEMLIGAYDKLVYSMSVNYSHMKTLIEIHRNTTT